MPKAFHGTIQEIVGGFHPLSHFGSLAAAQFVVEKRVAQSRNISKDIVPKHAQIYEVSMDVRKPFPIRDDKHVHSARDLDALILDTPYFVNHEDGGVSSVTKNELDALKSHLPYIRGPLHYLMFDRENIDGIPSLSDQAVKEELSCVGLFSIQHAPHADRQNLYRQRLILVLEKLGFDGFVYYNKAEDRNHISWMNFRPEQVQIIRSFPLSHDEQLADKGSVEAQNAPATAGDMFREMLEAAKKMATESSPLSKNKLTDMPKLAAALATMDANIPEAEVHTIELGARAAKLRTEIGNDRHDILVRLSDPDQLAILFAKSQFVEARTTELMNKGRAPLSQENANRKAKEDMALAAEVLERNTRPSSGAVKTGHNGKPTP